MRVVVIGGGPAGVSAALHAAELGAEVTLVERRRVGGTAFNSGPAPVRTLARAARLVQGLELVGNVRSARATARGRRRRHPGQRPAGGRLLSMNASASPTTSAPSGSTSSKRPGDARFVDANTVAAVDVAEWTADR